jgi:hypothetical protein
MTQCVEQLHLGILHGKRLTGGFDGGEISSDGGLMLVAAADERLGLTRQLAACLVDARDPNKIRHQLHELLAQRVYQIAAGYEDCNDADDLRHDPVLKTAVGRLPQSDPALGSQPTLSRFENAVTRRELRALAQVLVEQFIARHAATRPRYIVLDFDATDDETHGQQQFAEFHGFYDTHCYLPLIVTAQVDGGRQELLVALLRRGRSHASRGALAVLKRLVARLRQQWPGLPILVRGDSGFAIPALYDWCEAQQVPVWYLIGLAQHPRLRGQAAGLYDLYAARGEMENRIKELKCDLQMDRTSCHRFVANQFRVLLHAAAFVLCCTLREALAGTELATAQVGTLQRRLLKLGLRVKQTARRVWLQFASSCPLQNLWPVVLARLKPRPT